MSFQHLRKQLIHFSSELNVPSKYLNAQHRVINVRARIIRVRTCTEILSMALCHVTLAVFKPNGITNHSSKPLLVTKVKFYRHPILALECAKTLQYYLVKKYNFLYKHALKVPRRLA